MDATNTFTHLTQSYKMSEDVDRSYPTLVSENNRLLKQQNDGCKLVSMTLVLAADRCDWLLAKISFVQTDCTDLHYQLLIVPTVRCTNLNTKKLALAIKPLQESGSGSSEAALLPASSGDQRADVTIRLQTHRDGCSVVPFCFPGRV